MTKRHLIALALAGFCVLALSACGGGGSSASPKNQPTQTTVGAVSAGNAKITSFAVPSSVKCAQGTTSTTVQVTYGTSGSSKRQLSVDGRPMNLSAATGTVDAPVHCDALPHTFVLFAYDSAGRYSTQQKLLSTTS
jgi:hypothetical protein